MNEGQWLYEKPKPTTKHKCKSAMPNPHVARRGSIYLCGCGKRWRVSKPYDIFESGNAWHRLRRPMGRAPKTT